MPKKKNTHPRFGTRIIELRKKHHMTQEDLAKALASNQSTINYYENRAENPTMETIEKVASVFKLSAEEFMNPIERVAKKGGATSRVQKLNQELEKLSAYKQNLILDMLEAAIKRG